MTDDDHKDEALYNHYTIQMHSAVFIPKYSESVIYDLSIASFNIDMIPVMSVGGGIAVPMSYIDLLFCLLITLSWSHYHGPEGQLAIKPTCDGPPGSIPETCYIKTTSYSC